MSIIENTCISYLGDREFFWGRRYFPTEETLRSSVGERPLRYPHATLPSRIPRDREGLLKQIESVSRDLCILYSRMAVFRILRSFTKLKDKKDIFLEFLMTRRIFDVPPMLSLISPSSTSVPMDIAQDPMDVLLEVSESSDGRKDENEEKENEMIVSEDSDDSVSLMDKIFLLIRQSSASTQRTKIYLQTVAMLHSVSYLPQNIGSVFGAGGAPMLEQLRHSMSDMLSLSGSDSNNVQLCL